MAPSNVDGKLLSGMAGMLSAINWNGVRNQLELLSAFAGIRTKTEQSHRRHQPTAKRTHWIPFSANWKPEDCQTLKPFTSTNRRLVLCACSSAPWRAPLL